MSPDGEIIGVISVGDMVIHKSSIIAYKANQNRTYESDEPRTNWKLNKFSMVNTIELELLLPELTPNERNMLISIIPYVSYSSCILAYRNKKHIDIAGLIKITGMSRSVVYATIKSLGRKRLLCRYILDDGFEFIVNPWLVSKGKQINNTLKGIFKDYHIRVLNKRWGDLKEFQR